VVDAFSSAGMFLGWVRRHEADGGTQAP
jgi:hypothetical protein